MSDAGRKRVLLHVGSPKTGTSYLQDVLFRNQGVLEKNGILYPADRFDAHFLAALDLMRLTWGGLEKEAVGRWDGLAEQSRAWPGTTIISHEILATASRSQIARALESLGDTELHIVMSARDLVRQIPAEWQENVKHRRTFGYGTFLSAIQDPERADTIATWFWGVQELPDILDRWGAAVPPEHVHIVTVPKPGAPPTQLWERFATAFELTGIDLDLHAERSNPSLGAPETALVRRINQSVNKVLEPADYRPLVRELLAHQTLSRRAGSPRLALPPEVHSWAAELSASWVEELTRRGYDVTGDLSDLLADEPTTKFSDPDRPRESQVNAAAVESIKVLLLETARLRGSERELQGRLDGAHAALDRAYLRPTYRLREKVVNRLETGRWGRGLMKVYRRARGRSSLPA